MRVIASFHGIGRGVEVRVTASILWHRKRGEELEVRVTASTSLRRKRGGMRGIAFYCFHFMA